MSPSDNDNAALDPLSSLLAALDKANPPKAPEGGGELARAIALIPGRSETTVEDLLDSPELRAFRAKLRDAMIETNIVIQGLDILRELLIARGLIA